MPMPARQSSRPVENSWINKNPKRPRSASARMQSPRTLIEMAVMLNNYPVTDKIYQGTCHGNDNSTAILFADDGILERLGRQIEIFIDTSDRVSLLFIH